MIVGIEVKRKTKLEETLEAMHASGFVFNLTGSRAWKKDIPESTDWDFFTIDQVELGWFLEDGGFIQIYDSVYDKNDPSVVAVCRKTFPGEKTWIDVQLIHPSYMERKERINEVFKKIAPHASMPKPAWKVWWRVMFEQWPVLLPPPANSDTLPMEVQAEKALDFLAKNKILAIKALRSKYGLGLCEAKDRVDMLTEGKISNGRLNNYKRNG